MNELVIISIVFAIGVFFIFLGLDLIVSNRSIQLDKRVDVYKPSTPSSPTPAVTKVTGTPLARITPDSFQRQIAADLARADLPVTVSEFLTATLLTTLLGALVGFFISGENLFVALLLGIVGFVAPRIYVRYLQGKRLEAFEDGLPNTLVLLANSLRSGYGWGQAIETVAKEAAPPISTEFGRVNREIALGLSSEDALNNLLRRNPSLDLELVIMAINVNRQVGGNLSEILDQIASTIRDRVRLEEEIRTLTAQQRFTASVLTFLPPLVGVVIFIINSGYVALLWETTCGIVMLISAVIMLVLGYAVMQRILKVKF
jgi:tight adherence protein B